MSSIPSANSSTQSKTAQPAADNSRLATYRDIVKELLPKFPSLNGAPDVTYWLLATWWLESRWQLLFGHKSGSTVTKISLHYTASKPTYESIQGNAQIKGSATLTGRDYQYSQIIQSKWNDSSVTVDIRNNIKEGWYAHGITACMGCYHVRGTPANKQFKAEPEAATVISYIGQMEVDPGQSISQTLFPTDDTSSWRRSIAAGMIIFNSKFKAYLKKGMNPQTAMQATIGAYLGKAGVADANGKTPEERIADANNTFAGFVVPLKSIGVARTGDTTVLADTSNKASAPAGGATQVVNNTPAPATTNSGQTGTPEKSPGCSLT